MGTLRKTNGGETRTQGRRVSTGGPARGRKVVSKGGPESEGGRLSGRGPGTRRMGLGGRQSRRLRDSEKRKKGEKDRDEKGDGMEWRPRDRPLWKRKGPDTSRPDWEREPEGGANTAEGLGGKEGEERIRRKAGREVRDEAGRLLGVSAPTGLTFYRRSKNIVTYCDLLRSIYKYNDLLYKMVFYGKILQFEAYQRKNLAQ